MLKIPTVIFLICFALLAVIHIIALQLSLYWAFDWFDIPMHFFGGAIVALGVFTLNDLKIVVPDRWLHVSSVVLLVFLVAMVWEVYELLIGIPIESNYLVDTITDLCMGTLGGLVGYSIGTNIKKL